MMTDQATAERLVLAAYNAGVPQDQLENFLTRGYVPLPWQMHFHALSRKADNADGPVKIGAGGARGPGKSHAIFSQVALDDCQRVAGLKGLFLRQTGKAASESFEDLVLKVLTGKVDYKYVHQGVLRFPNDSRIILGGFETARDLDKYIGIEYDFIAIEELNQLTEDKIIKLLGSMRTTKENWRPRLYASFNPGGVGHAFVKSWFVDPFLGHGESETRFVPARYVDNPYLRDDYIAYLEGLKGDLGKAWREGDFDLFEGQYFAEWSREKHIISSFLIPDSWKRFRAYDHGRQKPACCLWGAIDYDGRIWIYRELYITGANVDKIQMEINRLSAGETYQFSVADPSIFSKQGFVDTYGAETIAEMFATDRSVGHLYNPPIMWMPASNRRVDGWNLVHKYLYWDKHTLPLAIFFNVCYNAIRTIPSLIHDELHPEDVDSDGEDHAADALRYLLMALHERKSMKPKSEVERKLEEMQRISTVSPSNLNRFYNQEL